MAINRSKKRTDVVPQDELTLQGTAPGDSLDAVIQIAEERTGYLEQMRTALISGDDVQLKLYAAKLCGLSPESVPKRPRAKLNGGGLKHGKE